MLSPTSAPWPIHHVFSSRLCQQPILNYHFEVLSFEVVCEKSWYVLRHAERWSFAHLKTKILRGQLARPARQPRSTSETSRRYTLMPNWLLKTSAWICAKVRSSPCSAITDRANKKIIIWMLEGLLNPNLWKWIRMGFDILGQTTAPKTLGVCLNTTPFLKNWIWEII